MSASGPLSAVTTSCRPEGKKVSPLDTAKQPTLVTHNEKYVNATLTTTKQINPYPTAFPYGNGMVLHFYQQQESSTTKTVHKVINKGLKTYV